jgi:ferritin-like metal-binding protein YciE
MSQLPPARIETIVEQPQQANDGNPADLTSLPNLIKTWKALQDETKEIQSSIREKKTRMKALEEMILQSMKRNNIGALDLNKTGGRVLYRRKNAKESLGQKNMAKLLGEALKSEQKAADALKYIDEHRGSKVKESLIYEADV